MGGFAVKEDKTYKQRCKIISTGCGCIFMVLEMGLEFNESKITSFQWHINSECLSAIEFEQFYVY